MGRFLYLTIVLIVGIGLVLHFGYEIPWFSQWFGNLPGDLTIRKGGVTIYIPLATSVLLSAAASIILSALFKPSK